MRAPAFSHILFTPAHSHGSRMCTRARASRLSLTHTTLAHHSHTFIYTTHTHNTHIRMHRITAPRVRGAPAAYAEACVFQHTVTREGHLAAFGPAHSQRICLHVFLNTINHSVSNCITAHVCRIDVTFETAQHMSEIFFGDNLKIAYTSSPLLSSHILHDR